MTKLPRVAGLLPLLLTGWSCGDKPDVYAISISDLKMDPDSSIVALDFVFSAGTVQAVQNIPIGWIMNVSDDASWRAEVKGNSTLPAASLSEEEVQRLVFIVRRNESGTLRFDVSGSLTTSKNFERHKQIELKRKDFLLAASPQNNAVVEST